MARRFRLVQAGVAFPHARGLRDIFMRMPDVEIVGLYDFDLDAARLEIEPALQKVPLYEDLALMLERERPDIVLINLPADMTARAIAQAAEAGAHVYAEKPCARSVADFRPAAEAIRKAGVQFATGYVRRFYPQGVAIKDIVDQGLLGRLVSIEARLITSSVKRRMAQPLLCTLFDSRRSGGGMLHWLGCHYLDFMRWVTSSEVVEVAAILGTLTDERIDVEDVAALSLRFGNGMIGSLHCAYVTDRSDQLFFGLRGTQGWVNWEWERPEIEVRSVHPAWSTAPTRVMKFQEDPLDVYCGAVGMHGLGQFVAAIRGEVAPAFTADDALRVLEILDAAHESDRTGRRVAIGEMARPAQL